MLEFREIPQNLIIFRIQIAYTIELCKIHRTTGKTHVLKILTLNGDYQY